MSWQLEVDQRALKEWRKLGPTLHEPLKKKRAVTPPEHQRGILPV